MDATHCTDVTADLWTPETPLPTRTLLRKLSGRILAAWDADDLATRVKVGYHPRLRTTLGRACYTDFRVELNPRLLGEHPGELIPTLAHELAHLVVFTRFGREARPHGREFRLLLRRLGLSDEARHDLPVAHLRRPRGKYLYLHRCCDCGSSFVARSLRRQYYCTTCGPGMEWDVFRVPNNEAGRKLLQRLQTIGKHHA